MSDEISINRDLKFNDMVKDFNENLVKALDINTPIITKTITDQFRIPWFTPEVKLNKQRFGRMEKVWICYKTDDSWTAYEVVSAEYKNVFRRA